MRRSPPVSGPVPRPIVAGVAAGVRVEEKASALAGLVGLLPQLDSDGSAERPHSLATTQQVLERGLQLFATRHRWICGRPVDLVARVTEAYFARLTRWWGVWVTRLGVLLKAAILSYIGAAGAVDQPSVVAALEAAGVSQTNDQRRWTGRCPAHVLSVFSLSQQRSSCTASARHFCVSCSAVLLAVGG